MPARQPDLRVRAKNRNKRRETQQGHCSPQRQQVWEWKVMYVRYVCAVRAGLREWKEYPLPMYYFVSSPPTHSPTHLCPAWDAELHSAAKRYMMRDVLISPRAPRRGGGGHPQSERVCVRRRETQQKQKKNPGPCQGGEEYRWMMAGGVETLHGK